MDRWDGQSPASVQLVLEPEHPFTAGFRTEPDTDEARTGTESIGVQFVDDSVPGNPDAFFVLTESVYSPPTGIATMILTGDL